MKLSKKYLALGLVGSVLAAGGAHAATQGVTADINFGAALALTSTNNMDFGVVTVTTGGTYTINSSTSAMAVGGGGEAISGTPEAGVVHIVGEPSADISIQVTSFTPSAHVTLTLGTCTFGASTNVDCTTAPIAANVDVSGASDLSVGARATIGAGATAGVAETPSLTVTVIYS